MYKNFSLEEIKKVKNNFIPHLYSIIKKEKCQWINDLVKIIFKEWNEVYYFDRWEIFFKIAKTGKDWEILELSDEIEKIQLMIPINEKSWLQRLIIEYITKRERQLWQKTIEEILFDAFKTWEYNTINGKPYLVYDIETTIWVWNNLDSYKFLLAYSMTPGNWKMDYEYIETNSLQAFAEKLINFDWYIIWFNSFAFDNPITIMQWWFTKKEVELINEKSLDIFYFIRNLTGKRIWLNKLSESLIWIQKTLTSWAWVNDAIAKCDLIPKDIKEIETLNWMRDFSQVKVKLKQLGIRVKELQNIIRPEWENLKDKDIKDITTLLDKTEKKIEAIQNKDNESINELDIEEIIKKSQEIVKVIPELLSKYCKNDVRMTAFVLLYLLHFKKIFIEWTEWNEIWKEIKFTLEDFVKLAKPKEEIKNDNTFINQAIF